MKKILTLLFATVLITVIFHYFYLRTKKPTEVYSDDIFLNQQTNKTALIIVAHDDDAISSAGSLIQLVKEGWTVKELCFYHQTTNEKLNKRNLQRQKDIQKVKEIEGLAEFRAVTIPYRTITDDSLSYMPIHKSDFGKYYNRDTVLFYIRQFINENNPSVIFTLDNNIGGYGHPDHILVSQLVLDECISKAHIPSFSVKNIYQAVFTPSMNKNIIEKLPVYQRAVKVYNSKQPLPDVQINISNVASQKKQAMLAYSTEQNSLKQIWPYYRYYPAMIYFRLFDREFFHVVPVTP